ncbi:tetratricopeptide repeat protein [uncultured Maritimibacter sp.]|uniref:tetratricopeptide repeat protein n=1 Tax=uncultured Maritimibacter sp. TaxID=991866 RepID=UPI00259546CC|nr:tetratricopeptide repeat protein [uncultured Maritimibacter sp.]
MRFLVPLLVATPIWADTCPEGPDTGDALAALIAEGQAAQTYMVARDALRDMWSLWQAPPDKWSGELLDVGLERMRVADYKGAQKAFDALVEYCPTWAEAWNQRAFVYFRQEDYAASLENIERALEIAPRHIPALSGKGVTLLKLGREDEGYDALRAAVDLHPWLPERGLIPELYGAPR